MPYKGDNITEKEALTKALKELRERRFSFPQLAKDITEAAKVDGYIQNVSDGIKIRGISRELLEKYMKRDPHESWPTNHPSAIYNFLEKSEKYLTKWISPIEGQSEGINRSLSTDIIFNYFKTTNSISYERLYGLEGKYEMFRRLWSSQSDNLFIRSIVTIAREGKWLSYVEEQNYIDPIKRSSINETDRGYLFVYDRNVFVLTKEDHEQCMKFVVIHDYFPYINGKSNIDIYAGNLISVSGTGSHPGYPFICRRIKGNDDAESRIVSIDQMDITCSKYFASDGKINI